MHVGVADGPRPADSAFCPYDAPPRADERSHQLVADGAVDGGTHLVTSAEDQRRDLRRMLHNLEPGRSHILVYSSRRSTIQDFRVIVRNRENARYIAQGSASPADRWRRTVLRFTAPDAEVSLELSPRTSGRCELDGFGLFRSR